MLKLPYLKIAPLIFANLDYTAGLQMYICHSLIGEQEHVGTVTTYFEWKDFHILDSVMHCIGILW